jgi:hypothetical protein
VIKSVFVLSYPLAAASCFLLRLHDGECLALGLDRVLGELLGNLHEQRLHVVGILGGRFQVQNTIFLRIRGRFLKFHLSTLFQISLVTRQRNDNVRVAPALQLLDPTFGTGKGIWIGNIINNNGGRGTSIIHGRQRSITLLAGRVPAKKDRKKIIAQRTNEKKFCGTVIRDVASCQAAGNTFGVFSPIFIPYQISNLTVESSRATVCVKKAAPMVGSWNS